MIYFICYFDSVSAANTFSEFGYEVWDGDNEFNAKINVTNPEEFKRFLNDLKQNNKKDIIEILDTYCNSFESDGEDIPEGLEDEIYSLIVEL